MILFNDPRLSTGARNFPDPFFMVKAAHGGLIFGPRCRGMSQYLCDGIITSKQSKVVRVGKNGPQMVDLAVKAPKKIQTFIHFFTVFSFVGFFHSRLRKRDFLCLFVLATKFICIETRVTFNIDSRYSSIEDAGVNC